MKNLAALAFVFLLCCGFTHGRGPQTFYVSNSGNDSNNGLTPATAWATPGKVNASHFNSGDTVAFDSGSTFSAGLALTQANAPGNLTITSTASGQPTFNTGNSTACVTITYAPGFTVNNINCVGGGKTTNSTEGILANNNGPGNVILQGPTISNNTITAYGWQCIAVWGSAGASGWSFATISGNSVSFCESNQSVSNPGQAVQGTGCIELVSVTQPFSSSAVLNVHINGLISGNTLHDCVGKSGLTSPSGDGILVGNATLTTVQNNLVHDTGSASVSCGGGGGNVGIIGYSSNKLTFQFNEVYNVNSAGGCDGESMDFDGDVQNSIAQYNYIHGTANTAYLLTGPFSSTTNDSNIFRFNLIEGTSGFPAISVGSLSDSCNPCAGVTNFQVYNNTIYSGTSCFSAANVAFTKVPLSINFSNNICYGTQNSFTSATSSLAGSKLTVTGNDYYNSSTPGTNAWSIAGTVYSTLAAFQAACSSPTLVFEKTGGCVTTVGTQANPNVTGTVAAGGNCLQGTPFTTPCPNAYTLSSASPAGKGNGLNLNSLYSFSVGTQDFYGNAITNTTLPIGAAANK